MNDELTEDLFVWFCIMTGLNKPEDKEYLHKTWAENWWKFCPQYRKITLQDFISDFEKDINLSNKTIGFSNN